MQALDDHRLCVLGGYINGNSGAVQIMDLQTQTSTHVGNMRHRLRFGQALCEMGDYIIICGACDWEHNNHCEVWDTRSHETIRCVPMPNFGRFYGAVLVQGHLVVVNQDWTCVSSIEDIMQESRDCFQRCDNYVTPNNWCAVVVCDNGESLMLLGGSPKHTKPTHFVYKALVQDIIQNSPTGWSQVSTPWTLGDCVIYGGYDVAHVTLPTSWWGWSCVCM